MKAKLWSSIIILMLLCVNIVIATQVFWQYDPVSKSWTRQGINDDKLQVESGKWYSVMFYYPETLNNTLTILSYSPLYQEELGNVSPPSNLSITPPTPPFISNETSFGECCYPRNCQQYNDSCNHNCEYAIYCYTVNTTNTTITKNETNITTPATPPTQPILTNTEKNYRNAFMIAWDGKACDNIQYAKNLGYDYVMYQDGMEKCPGYLNVSFYYESPDSLTPQWQIFYGKNYTQEQINLYNNWFLWKSNDPFPNNLATGWFFGDGSFRPIPNLQQQWVIDSLINRSLQEVKKREVPSKGFTFGGWSWDVPQLDGDLWSGMQQLDFFSYRANGTGKQVTISYWTGTCGGVNPYNDYKCFTDGKAEFYKQLFAKTKQQYPNMKVYLEPYNMWSSYFRDIVNRTDRDQLIPDFACSESGKIDFINDQRILKYVPASNMCSDTPDVFTHSANLNIMGNLAVKGAWFNWFGRIGGTGDFAPLNSMREVPDRLKLLRAIPGWDNLDNVPLSQRSFVNGVYKSTNSYADSNIIYSTNPRNHLLYVVVLNNNVTLPFINKTYYKLDALFGLTNTTIDTITTGVAFVVVDSPFYNTSLNVGTTPQSNSNSSEVIVLPIYNESKGFCGDGICIGRNASRDAGFSVGLNAENWDNCPQDCGFQYNARNIGKTYRTKDQVYNYYINLTNQYSDIARYEVIGKTISNKDILMFVAGNGPGKFMFDGQAHGVEDCGTETGGKFFEWALTSSHPEAQQIREKNTLYFIPIINDQYRRQNGRTYYVLANGSLVYTPYGIDLNRNFPSGWGNTGSSDPKNSYEYRGLFAGSEPETQAIIYAQTKYKPQFYMNVHCGMQMFGVYGNTTLSNKVLNNIKVLSNETGSKTLTVYSPHIGGGIGSGGYVATNNCGMVKGSSCALFEISEWGNLPVTLEDYHLRWYPSAFPVYMSGVISVQQ